MRDRLAAGRRVLAPLTQVRILVPQPKTNGVMRSLITPFPFSGAGPRCHSIPASITISNGIGAFLERRQAEFPDLPMLEGEAWALHLSRTTETVVFVGSKATNTTVDPFHKCP